MSSWSKFTSTNTPLNLRDRLSKAIITELGKANIEFFSITTSRRPNRTRFIKDKIALLGHHKFGYKVYANGLSKNLIQTEGGIFKNREWMFDLHWYTEGIDPYTTIQLPLVMECEWQQKDRRDRTIAFSGIKYDFQKLLIANASLRLMIFRVTKIEQFDTLFSYFENNIKQYKHLVKGARFLFVGFHEREKTFYYKETFKP